MVISCSEERDRRYLVRYAKDMAGRYTEESWSMLQCGSPEELKDLIKKKIFPDMICVDITVSGVLPLVAELRQEVPGAYIILIASPRISPLVYLRPSIRAESLMLKPLTAAQIEEVMAEAIRTYAKRFYQADTDQTFILENSGERTLIDYGRILFFEAREKRVCLYTETEEYAFYDTLDHLEESLFGQFLRCHRSFLVNKEKITKVYLSKNQIVLEGDVWVPLSRTYKPAVKEYLKGRSVYGGEVVGKGNSLDL